MSTRPFALAKPVFVLVLGCGLLVGCKSAEERAADAFEQAVQLMQDGDTARVGIAFQNVFKYAPDNTEAREIYADFLRETGDTTQAAGQYLRLVEQQPDHLAALVAVTELAMESYGWEVAQTYLARAQKIAPARPDIVAMGRIMDYVLAIGADDSPARDAATTAMANAAQEVQLLPLSRALADGLLRRNEPQAALAIIDAALQHWPKDRVLHDQRLLELQALADPDAVATQFRDMIDLFPESRDIATRYVDWLARKDQIGVAEEFLRQRARVTSGGVARTLDLIAFLATWKGPDAVLADLDTLIDGDADPLLYRAMRASVVFQTGAQQDAIADLQTIIAEAAASSVDSTRADANRYRIVLARMLDHIGDRAGAEAVIAPVVAERPNLADAAALQAQFLLDKGRNVEAISTLRAALGADASDPQLLLLLARAHSAQGAHALATRTLSLAFTASGHAPETALIFAAQLAKDGRTPSAIEVLTRALSVRPQHPGLLSALGVLYIDSADWNRAAQIIQSLRALTGVPIADSAAKQLELTMLAARAPVDDALAAIQTQNPADRSLTYLALVQAYMAAGRTDDARLVLDEALKLTPDNRLLLALAARLASLQGRNDQAIGLYRALLAKDPSDAYLWAALADVVATVSDTDAALEVLGQGLEALPASLRLEWARALLLQQADRSEEAILAYEALLTRAPDNLPARNNLASLLSTVRQDEASLSRAAELAAALDRSELPQFRNTLGWIRFRQGDVTGAVGLLVPAAESLADDALAQVQAAEALIAAKQMPRARLFLTRAMDLAPPGTQIAERARKGLAEIDAISTQSGG